MDRRNHGDSESSDDASVEAQFDDVVAVVEPVDDPGLTDTEYISGPAEFVGPVYMIRDERLGDFLKILGRLVTHPA